MAADNKATPQPDFIKVTFDQELEPTLESRPDQRQYGNDHLSVGMKSINAFFKVENQID